MESKCFAHSPLPPPSLHQRIWAGLSPQSSDFLSLEREVGQCFGLSLTLFSSSRCVVRVSPCQMKSHLTRVSYYGWFLDEMYYYIYFILWFLHRSNVSVALLQAESLWTCLCFYHLSARHCLLRVSSMSLVLPISREQLWSDCSERQVVGWMIPISECVLSHHCDKSILLLMQLSQINKNFSTSFSLQSGQQTQVKYSLVCQTQRRSLC